MKTTLQRVEEQIAEIDAFFAAPSHFRQVTMADMSNALLTRWKLAVLRDELRAQHERMAASFDTCSSVVEPSRIP